MKRVFFLICGFIFVFAGIGLAVEDGQWGTSMSTISFSPSKNVSIYWDVDSTNQSFAIGSKHRQGNRIFATTSATSQIYYKESDDYVGKTGAETGVTMPGAGSTVTGWHSI